MKLTEFFLNELQNLVGLECWGITGGEGTGSIITIDVGEKILRGKPLQNSHLSPLVKKYNSSFGFMLHSPWRIYSKEVTISGSHMTNERNGKMITGLDSLLKKTITKVECTKPAFDLTIEFSSNIKLVVYCANIDMPYTECYTFHSPKGWFEVVYDGKLSFEENKK